MSDDLPASVKILRLFKDMKEVRKDEIDIFRDIREAVRTLVDMDALHEKKDMYKQGPRFEPTQRKMQEVHNQVVEIDTERETKEWIMRGSLIDVLFVPYRPLIEERFFPQGPFSYRARASINLYRILQGIRLPLKPLNFVYEVLPFDQKEVEEFLKRESKRELIEITKVLNRSVPPSQEYFHSPYWFYRDIRAQKNFSPKEIERIKESWKGSKIYEEYFVYGKYTKNVRDEAQGYLDARYNLRGDIRGKIEDRLYAEWYQFIQPDIFGRW